MSTQHTPGKIATVRRHPDPHTAAKIIQIIPESVAESGCYSLDDICTFYCAPSDSVTEADANRLVACWNACEGIADPSAIPDLLAALTAWLALHDGACARFSDNEDEDFAPEVCEVLTAARAAIARAKGPTQ